MPDIQRKTFVKRETHTDGIINGWGEERRRTTKEEPMTRRGCFCASEMTGEFVWLTVGMSRLSHSVSNSVGFLKQCANSRSRGEEKKKSLLAFGRNGVTFLNGA